MGLMYTFDDCCAHPDRALPELGWVDDVGWQILVT